MSTLMPFSFMDTPDFKDFANSLNGIYYPYTGARLMSVTARNCYIPSLVWLKHELSVQLTSLSRSLVINLDPLSNIANKSFIGCTISYIDSKWERKSFFLAMMPLDEKHSGHEVGRALELMCSEVFGVHRQAFLAIVGEE